MATAHSTPAQPLARLSEHVPSFVRRHRDLLTVLATALAFRVLFALLISNTYDYDEFVILLLGRDFAHGLTPYADFRFFHPPGVLVLMRILAPLLSAWWPSGRAVSILVDSTTAGLVWWVGRATLDRRTAVVGGLLYAISPVALVSAARVSQDPLITMLGFAGLAALVRSRSWRAAGLAGICLGLAAWVKYPALYFLPVYLLVGPRRAPAYLACAAATLLLCFLPFHAQFHQIYADTVTFQRTRWQMPLATRLETAALYWIGANALALAGLAQARRTGQPLWVIAGFLLGGVFMFTSQVYYHYFVPVVPFAALLGAPIVVRLIGRAEILVITAGLLLLLAWAALINSGGPSTAHLTAAHLSSLGTTISLLERSTAAAQPVLADRYEYAFLARRPALAHYFWNVGPLVTARQLERSLPGAGAVVMSYGASSGYPPGFTQYLNRHYRRVETGAAAVWLPARGESR